MGATVRRVEFKSCSGQMTIDAHLFRGQVWWRITTPSMPDRWVRLRDTARALNALTHAYAFVDGDLCVNSSKTSTVRHLGDPHPLREDATLSALTDEQRWTEGVPQRTHDSGLCWYSAMCFVMLFSDQMRALLRRYMPPALSRLCAGVLVDPARAEALRAYLYGVYAVGDRPGQPPHLDGQNGGTQLLVLLAQLGVPTRVLFAPDLADVAMPLPDQRGVRHAPRAPAPGEPALLMVRAFRTAWTPTRRLVVDGRRFRLVAMLLGSEHCGHQIGASTVDMCVNRWALSDADACKKGIGPMFWSIGRRRGETRAQFRNRWRTMWQNILPVTRFGAGQRRMCHFNPGAVHELEEQYALALGRPPARSAAAPVNCDYLYLAAA